MNYAEYKCPKCSCVHTAIPFSVAGAQVASANESSRSQGKPQVASIKHHWQCFRCGASTQGFVPAGRDDALIGCTIQGVVVLGILPLHARTASGLTLRCETTKCDSAGGTSKMMRWSFGITGAFGLSTSFVRHGYFDLVRGCSQ